MQEKDPRWQIIHFRRNFGQTAAMAAGFDAARGEIVVTIDADLQNDPRDIQRILDKFADGYGHRQRMATKPERATLPSPNSVHDCQPHHFAHHRHALA